MYNYLSGLYRWLSGIQNYWLPGIQNWLSGMQHQQSGMQYWLSALPKLVVQAFMQNWCYYSFNFSPLPSTRKIVLTIFHFEFCGRGRQFEVHNIVDILAVQKHVLYLHFYSLPVHSQTISNDTLYCVGKAGSNNAVAHTYTR